MQHFICNLKEKNKKYLKEKIIFKTSSSIDIWSENENGLV